MNRKWLSLSLAMLGALALPALLGAWTDIYREFWLVTFWLNGDSDHSYAGLYSAFMGLTVTVMIGAGVGAFLGRFLPAIYGAVRNLTVVSRPLDELLTWKAEHRMALFLAIGLGAVLGFAWSLGQPIYIQGDWVYWILGRYVIDVDHVFRVARLVIFGAAVGGMLVYIRQLLRE